MLELKAEPRTELGSKVNKKRKSGQIPAVVYGHAIDARSLYVPSKEFNKVYKEAGESSIIGLELEGKKRNVLIHEVQRDVISGNFLHVDFYQVRMDEKIKTKVPLEFIGESEAIKALGGILVKSIQEIEIEALPHDLPHHIEVNISSLKTFENKIAIKDLAINEKVKILADVDEIVALVTPPRSEEELAALEQKVEVPVEDVKVVGEEEKAEEAETMEKTEEKK